MCKTCKPKKKKKNKKVRIYRKKDLVEYETTIDEFHDKHYQKSIYKLAHHLPHVKILGTNETGKTRKEAFKGDMQSK